MRFHGQGIGRAAFMVVVSRAKTHPNPNPNPKRTGVELKPGMTATVDIRTGHRAVLKYLAKPVYRAFGGAMNEQQGRGVSGVRHRF